MSIISFSRLHHFAAQYLRGLHHEQCENEQAHAKKSLFESLQYKNRLSDVVVIMQRKLQYKYGTFYSTNFSTNKESYIHLESF